MNSSFSSEWSAPALGGKLGNYGISFIIQDCKRAREGHYTFSFLLFRNLNVQEYTLATNLSIAALY